MPESPECLLIVTVEIDAAIETEWNRWYVYSGEISESLAGATERTATSRDRIRHRDPGPVRRPARLAMIAVNSPGSTGLGTCML